MSTALCGVACCTDDLVLDDLDDMEAKSALDQLLVALWSRDAWNGDTALVLKRKSAPLAAKLWRRDRIGLIWRLGLYWSGWLSWCW